MANKISKVKGRLPAVRQVVAVSEWQTGFIKARTPSAAAVVVEGVFCAINAINMI